jgi:ribosomal subunit interface protein
MRIIVTGKQIDIGTSLTGHVEDRLLNATEKYFNQAVEGTVTFSKNAHLQHADVQVHLGHGVHLNTSAEADDIYAAFEAATEKLETRLRRYKRRLTNHHKERRQDKSDMAAHYNVLQAEADQAAEPEESNPVVVAEMQTYVPEVTVSEAVMRLDLGALQTLMFKNTAHGGLNVVYRREDGNIGWIDPR